MIGAAHSLEHHATLPPASRGKSFRLDDVRFSDSMTVEHNVLAPGVIGHIARHREIDITSYEPSATDTWFHYDQVGSVMCTSGSSGQLASVYHPDAFGNRMTTWQSGLWTDSYTTREGWHHNTKELDGNTGLVYMYQRWYLPETGTFGSKAPIPPHIEHQYDFVFDRPTMLHDTFGTNPRGWPEILPPPPMIGGNPDCCKGKTGVLFCDCMLDNCSGNAGNWAQGCGVACVAGCLATGAAYFHCLGGCELLCGMEHTALQVNCVSAYLGCLAGLEKPGPVPPKWPPPITPPGLCPRIDAWYEDLGWVEVGRAIKFKSGLENEGVWRIELERPASKFRLVEDEPEISYVYWIKGDGEDWGLGEITTNPASYLGATDGSIHEFRFSKEVLVLETKGYYEVLIPQTGKRYEQHELRLER